MNKKTILKKVNIFLLSIVFVLLFSTTVKAQTVNSIEEKEKFYEDIIAFMNENVDPSCHKNSMYMSSSYGDLFRGEAEYWTRNCTTDYEKIKAIARFVANDVSYDYVNYKAHTYENAMTDPYQLLTSQDRITICDGYAEFSRELLISIGIPCMSILAEDHKYNAAYDSDSKRWIIFDSTWMSGNGYYGPGDRVWNECDEYWFDATPELLAENDNHEIYDIDGIKIGDYKYALSFSYKYEKQNPLSNWNEYEAFVTVTGVDLSITETVLPESIMGMPIKEVSFNYRNCRYLKKVVIEADLEEVPSAFFKYNTSLESVVFKHAPKIIKDECFANCSNLKEVVIPEGLKEISRVAFYYCSGLQEFTIPKGVETIGQKAFTGCKGIVKIVVPRSVTDIDPDAFGAVNYAAITFVCQSGSYAEQYAINHYFKTEIFKGFTGLKYEDNKWVYYNDDVIDYDYAGLVEYNKTPWYVANGTLDKSFSGYAKLGDVTYRVLNGKADLSATGLKYTGDKWAYCKAGVVQTDYTGLVYYGSDWWYVTEGFLDKAFKGVTPMNNSLWFIRNGKISRENGITTYDGNIYWITNGAVDTSVTDLKYNASEGKWYYFRKGVVDWNYNTLAYANNKWWYINNGELDKSYTGLVLFRGQLWYVKNGELDKAFVGTVSYKGASYSVKDGIGTKE